MISYDDTRDMATETNAYSEAVSVIKQVESFSGNSFLFSADSK